MWRSLVSCSCSSNHLLLSIPYEASAMQCMFSKLSMDLSPHCRNAEHGECFSLLGFVANHHNGTNTNSNHRKCPTTPPLPSPPSLQHAFNIDLLTLVFPKGVCQGPTRAPGCRYLSTFEAIVREATDSKGRNYKLYISPVETNKQKWDGETQDLEQAHSKSEDPFWGHLAKKVREPAKRSAEKLERT